MPEANTTPAAVKPEVLLKTPAKAAYEPTGPVTEETVVEAIRELIADWSEQNQGVAKIDVTLGSFRTLVQTQRIVLQD